MSAFLEKLYPSPETRQEQKKYFVGKNLNFHLSRLEERLQNYTWVLYKFSSDYLNYFSPGIICSVLVKLALSKVGFRW